MKNLIKSLYAFILLAVCNLGAQAPNVSNISYAQRLDQEGNRMKLVDIQYDLEGNRSMFVEFFFSHDGGVTFPVTCTAVTGDAGPGVDFGAGQAYKMATWDASVDWDQQFTDLGRIMIKATYGDQPSGFPGLDENGTGPNDDNNSVSGPTNIETVAIPFPAAAGIAWGPTAGLIYDYQTAIDAGDINDFPVRFHVDKYEVTLARWNEVVLWGRDNGYSDLNELPVGQGRSESAELAFGDFQNVVKWLNARSEMEGLEPVFYLELREPGSDENGDGQISSGPDSQHPNESEQQDPNFSNPFQDPNFNPDLNNNGRWDQGEYFIDRNGDDVFQPNEFHDWNGNGVRDMGLSTVYRVGTIVRDPPVNQNTGLVDFPWFLVSHAKLSANGYRLPSAPNITESHPVLVGTVETQYLTMGGRAEQGIFDQFTNRTVYMDEWPWGGTEENPTEVNAVVPPNTMNPSMMVGTKAANGYGLFDMIGNASELSLGVFNWGPGSIQLSSYGGSGTDVPVDQWNMGGGPGTGSSGPALWLSESISLPTGFRAIRLEF